MSDRALESDHEAHLRALADGGVDFVVDQDRLDLAALREARGNSS